VKAVQHVSTIAAFVQLVILVAPVTASASRTAVSCLIFHIPQILQKNAYTYDDSHNISLGVYIRGF
jgi:hypothetical protein